MRIIFFGYQSWGHICLKSLIENNYEIPLIVTHPQSSHPYEKIWSESVIDLAKQNKIEVWERRDVVRKKDIDYLKKLNADLFVLSNWRKLMKPNVFSIPKLGTINIHDSLLPEYAGFAPINWAIANGETKTGVTVHFVDYGIDTGDIILQKVIPIGSQETATDILQKVLPSCSKLMLEAIGLIERGEAPRIKQDLTKRTFYHKRGLKESSIDWNKSNLEIYNLIRAQSDPYPNVFTKSQGKILKIKKASLSKDIYNGTPGRIFAKKEKGVVVICGETRESNNQGLVIEVVQEENRKPMPANDYFKSLSIYLG